MSVNFGKEFEKEVMKEFEKAMGMPLKSMPNSGVYVGNSANNTINGNCVTVTIGDGWGLVCGHTDNSKDFIPTKIVFNPPATVCFFPDGSKIVVKCASDEEFVEEEGVMACIVKKIFKTRNAFKKMVAAAYRQPKPESKTEPEPEIENAILEPASATQKKTSEWENDGGVTLQMKE